MAYIRQLKCKYNLNGNETLHILSITFFSKWPKRTVLKYVIFLILTIYGRLWTGILYYKSCTISINATVSLGHKNINNRKKKEIIGTTSLLDLSIVRYPNEHNVSGTGSVSETLCLPEYRTMDKVQKSSNSEQYSPSLEHFRTS
jgi:hypothetical protein